MENNDLSALSVTEIEELIHYLTSEEQKELDQLLYAGDAPVWTPLEGPQLDAFNADADITGYGGSAGGGKTDLIAGLSLTKHKRVLIARREKAQTEGVVQRFTEIMGSTDGLNSMKGIWRMGDTLVEFAGLDNLGDERRWQGRAHDLKAFDEVTEMREAQVRFVMGWLRSNDQTVNPRVLMTFNPPTTAEGQWVIAFFGPWLDKRHPNPALPGELRWFTTLQDKDGQPKDVEVPNGREFVIDEEGEHLYDFDKKDYSPEQIIKPKSRTFIPARVTDNPYYMATGYMSTLQSLPEPLRSQMLNGDFAAGLEDDPWQIMPTAWVDAAMERWKHRDKKGKMDSMGVDVARGGKDNTIIARRHGMWFDEPVVHPGDTTPDGPSGAARVIAARRGDAPIHIDLIGWGASVYDFLNDMSLQVIGINAANKSLATDQSGQLQFANHRAELHWRMREALDPANDTGICLPPDDRLRADLCAPIWFLRSGKIQVELKDEVKKRIGRSPDYGDAYLMALVETVPWAVDPSKGAGNPSRRDYNPLAMRNSRRGKGR